MQVSHSYPGSCELSVVIPVYNEEAGLDALIERALNGVTTIRLRTGGAVEVGHGPDRRLIASPLRPNLTQGDLR